MILSQEMADRVGAAVNAGRSLFLFGAPGNGKTMLAERIGRMLGGNIAVPYAIESDGQIIQLFDLLVHRPVPQTAGSGADRASGRPARPAHRRIRRPPLGADPAPGGHGRRRVDHG